MRRHMKIDTKNEYSIISQKTKKQNVTTSNQILTNVNNIGTDI